MFVSLHKWANSSEEAHGTFEDHELFEAVASLDPKYVWNLLYKTTFTELDT
jgi:hypothetical protein